MNKIESSVMCFYSKFSFFIHLSALNVYKVEDLMLADAAMVFFLSGRVTYFDFWKLS